MEPSPRSAPSGGPCDLPCSDTECGCTCQHLAQSGDPNPWLRILQDVPCSGIGGGGQGPTGDAHFGDWQLQAGSPIRSRTAADALLGAVFQGAPPSVAATPDVLNASWYPGLLTLGSAGGSSAGGCPSFAGYSTADPDFPNLPAVISIGLSAGCVQTPDRPSTWVDFADPMRAVWVELDAPTDTPSCGVRFQHKVVVPGGPPQYVTIAALKPTAIEGGVVIDIANLALLLAQPPCADTFYDYSIDRVVFDPPEAPSASPPKLSRLVRVAWQTMDCAVSATHVNQPYRLVAIGSLAPAFDLSVQGSESGTAVLSETWPVTDYRFRMNSKRVVAGTYYRAPASGTGGGLRPAIWYHSGLAWTKLELQEAATAARTDMIACALSEPYLDGNNFWVIMVGGARRERCIPNDTNVTCGKWHAAAWCVRLGGYSPTVGTITPTAVTAVPVATDCQGSEVDESVIRDIMVASIPSDSGHFEAVGCGAVGMWCGEHGSPAAGAARTHAAAFRLRATGGTGYAGDSIVVHYGLPQQCVPGDHSSPADGDPKWSSTVASGWVRGAAGQWEFSAVGQWEGDLTCLTEEDVGCDRYSSAMQWDWSAWGWDTGQPYNWQSNVYPWLRAAPPGNRRPNSGEGQGGDNGGGKGGGEPPSVENRTFAALSAVRTTLHPTAATSTTIVSSVGWLVDGCVSLAACGCNWNAALYEYPDAVDGSCWYIDQYPSKPRINRDATTLGCMHILNLHDAIWTAGGADDNLGLTPYSKAAAVAAPPVGNSQHLRLVLGAAFTATSVDQSVVLDSQRAVIWRGSSESLTASPYVPQSVWCGRKIQTMIRSVIRPAEPPADQVATWAALTVHPPPPNDSAWFYPSINSGQDITDTGRVLCIARLSPTSAYQLCILMSPFDLNDDGVVDGFDLGAVLGGWVTQTPEADFNGDGRVDGFDLGALLGAWGDAPTVDFSCDGTALSSQDLEVVLHAAQLLGFEDFDDLQSAMMLMPPPQAGYLAEFIKITADQIGAGGGAP